MVTDAESIRRLNKMYIDMYEGDGKENPSITARLALLEVAVDKINSNLSKIVWLLLSVFAGVGANLLVLVFKR